MDILLTGSTGFVGSHVVSALRKRKVNVHVLVREGQPSPSGVHAVTTPLEDLGRVAKLVSEMDAVGHFAASPDPAFVATERAAVGAMLKVMRAGQRFSMQSGTLVFGDTGEIVTGENPPRRPPAVLKDRSAWEAHLLCAAQPSVSVVYGSLVYGGPGAMIPRALQQAALNKGQLLGPLFPRLTWSGVHVRDWADLIASSLCVPGVTGGPLFAAGPLIPLQTLVEKAGMLLEVPVVTTDNLEELISTYGFFSPVFMTQQQFSDARARKLYGWKAEHTDWEQEISEQFKVGNLVKS